MGGGVQGRRGKMGWESERKVFASFDVTAHLNFLS